MTPKDERAERLAAQLRENLKRRKARARAEEEALPHPPPENEQRDR
ncbi:MAG: hypothetical protein ACRCSO_12770 [Sphingomonas sp.]